MVKLTKIQKRINRIKGQLDGIARMIDGQRDCSDVLTQIKAARAGLNAIAEEVIKNEAECCIQNGDSPEQQSLRLQGLVKSLVEIE